MSFFLASMQPTDITAELSPCIHDGAAITTTGVKYWHFWLFTILQSSASLLYCANCIISSFFFSPLP